MKKTARTTLPVLKILIIKSPCSLNLRFNPGTAGANVSVSKASSSRFGLTIRHLRISQPNCDLNGLNASKAVTYGRAGNIEVLSALAHPRHQRSLPVHYLTTFFRPRVKSRFILREEVGEMSLSPCPV